MCKPIKFREFDCCLSIEQYHTKSTKGINRIALILRDLNNDDYVAVATVNLPEEPLDKDEVIIKDYSENEGMYKTLHDAEIISAPVRLVKTGFVECPVCKLLIK